jgi:CBS domain-containing protein
MATLVRHSTTEEPKTLSASMSVADAAAVMASYDVGSIPVLDHGSLVGIVTDRDIVIDVGEHGVTQRRPDRGTPDRVAEHRERSRA